MKTSLCVLRAASLISALLIGVPGVLLADKTVQPQAVTPDSGGSEYDLQIVDGKLLRRTGSVDATLANVVDALRERYTDANIVFAPSLATIKVGDVKLRSGRLIDELEGVRVAAGEKFDVQMPGHTTAQIDPTTGLQVGAPSQANSALFVLREAVSSPQSRRRVEAFNIGPYLDWLGRLPVAERKPEGEALEEISRMLHDTISDFKGESYTEADQPKCQYHRGATMLVIIGTPEMVEIARTIVNALPGMNPGREQQLSSRDSPQQRAEDAFRARYGLAPRTGPPGQPATAPPDAGNSK